MAGDVVKGNVAEKGHDAGHRGEAVEGVPVDRVNGAVLGVDGQHIRVQAEAEASLGRGISLGEKVVGVGEQAVLGSDRVAVSEGYRQKKGKGVGCKIKNFQKKG